MTKLLETNEDFTDHPGLRTVMRGYSPLEFIPSEEFVINSMNENGKCFIHCHLSGGKIVTEEWNNNNGKMTGPIFYNRV